MRVDFVAGFGRQQLTFNKVNARVEFNTVAGLFGNNLNIYESRDDPVTSRNKSVNF